MQCADSWAEQVETPFKPKVKGIMDISNFSSHFTNDMVSFPQVSPSTRIRLVGAAARGCGCVMRMRGCVRMREASQERSSCGQCK
jgi:hypothetical protein